uniref:glutathione transferase n=1 Tax=Eisenia fetida TaxID=6396 RepID=A0A2I7YV07_EISFE|nr:glutathion S-transferase pi [Eisenia fetida]
MPYKLQYFPVRGRAQALRYIVVDNDLEVQEEVINKIDWPAMKPKTPLGQLPVFHDGDLHISQSNAILRYVARKHGLFGKNDKEAALIDMINDQQEDIRQAYMHLIYQEYDTGKDAYIKNLPTQLATLEKVLGENKGGAEFFVGDKISFVDYTIFDLLDNLIILSPTCLDGFPKLKGFHSRIGSRDKIAKYRATDAFKKLPINGNGKQ